MQKTILQVPVDSQLKDSAEKAANRQGFSSLQELVRVFLVQLASNKIEVTLEKSIVLSPKNEKRYVEMTKDFELGENIYSAKDIKDLVSKLNEN